jgi:hypothetical protein
MDKDEHRTLDVLLAWRASLALEWICWRPQE